MKLGDLLILLSILPLIGTFLFSAGKYKKLIRTLQVAHLTAIISVIGLLYYYIFDNQFQYFYVYNHSSIDLPTTFKISCLWEGQEGSFLLWVFWNAIIGLGLSLSKNKLLHQSLIVLNIIQGFLISMVLGWEIPALDVYIGSSPFTYISEEINSKIFTIKPDFVFADGTGMNALLQNYWMVIHPPVIFLGFAVSAVPFCFCIVGLLKKETIDSWVKPAFNWVILSVITIGTGMIMGAYWAYETLNFGGFWNWDPVENAIYVPWLIQIVVLHLLILYKNKKKALKVASGLTLASFLLVIYSTFLTRSGILGETSVHAFTGLGLSGQLLFFLLVFVLMAIVVFLRASRSFPPDKQETVSVRSYEFWLLIGVLLLFLAAFQVLLPTSFPVFNELGLLLGVYPNLAPPANQVEFYTKFQLWFALGLLMSLAIAQVFYWRKSLAHKWIDILFIPFVASTFLSIVFFLYFGAESYLQIFSNLLTIFCTVFNIYLLLAKYSSLCNSTGSISHIGFALMVSGILISQGYQKVMTDQQLFNGVPNSSGNTLLIKNKPAQINGYEITFLGSYYKAQNGDFIEKNTLIPDRNKKIMVTQKDQVIDGQFYKKNELVQINRENIYHKVNFNTEGKSFNIMPRVQFNRQMGVIPSPDIDHKLTKDIYTYVSNFPDENKKPDWSKSNSLVMEIGEKWVYGNKIIELESVKELPLSNDSTLALKAYMKYSTFDTTYSLTPILLKGNATRVIEDEVASTGFKIVFDSVNEENKFGFSYLSVPKEWITIKSVQFPFIFLVWLGGILLILGLSFSLFFKLKWNMQTNTKYNYTLVRLKYRLRLVQFIKNQHD